jgi:hypothetical protein
MLIECYIFINQWIEIIFENYDNKMIVIFHDFLVHICHLKGGVITTLLASSRGNNAKKVKNHCLNSIFMRLNTQFLINGIQTFD